MFGVVFEWSIVNMYENYDLVGNGFFKYIHYDFTYASRYFTVALTLVQLLSLLFFSWLNVGWYIHILQISMLPFKISLKNVIGDLCWELGQEQQ